MKYLLRTIILAAAAALLVMGGCRQKNPPAGGMPSYERGVYPEGLAGEPRIRVRVLCTETPLELTVTGPYRMKVVTAAGEEIPGAGKTAVTIRAEATAGGVKLGRDLYRRAEIIPEPGSALRVRGGAGGSTYVFSGAHSFSRDANGRLQVVASLPMEHYLAGVVAGEMPLSYPPEALKVQAVASRTYALYSVKTRAARDYDVVGDVGDQMWKPEAAGDARARLAVSSTRGQVVVEGHRLFPARFCADCGGETASGRLIFGDTVAALSGGVKCGFQEKWKPLTLTKEEISRRLSAAGLGNGRLNRLELLDGQRNPLGGAVARAYFVRLHYDNGVERVVSGNDFRLALGGQKIRSMLLNAGVTSDGGSYVFSGAGFGHGVGMCQKGSRFEADQGRTYRQILAKYYRNAEIVKVW